METMISRLALLFVVILIATSSRAPGQTPPNASSPAFADGLAAREAWETWLSGQNGAYSDGIQYWAANRSLKSPQACESASADQAFVAGCKAAQARLAPVDLRRRSYPDYRSGFNSYQAAVQPSSSTMASSTPSNSPPATYGTIAYGNKAGEEATITRLFGVGTYRASVSAIVGPVEIERYCTAQNEEVSSRASCIAFYMKEHPQPRIMSASADCTTGDFVDFDGRKLEYAGKRKKEGYDEPVIDYEGFELGQFEYIGVSTSADQFVKMCPNWNREPPDLPELHLGDCDQQNAEHAAKLTTESGLAHIANLQAIDVWDVKGVGTTWNEVRCQAKVTYNTGRDVVLTYILTPRHGKYFISAQNPF